MLTQHPSGAVASNKPPGRYGVGHSHSDCGKFSKNPSKDQLMGVLSTLGIGNGGPLRIIKTSKALFLFNFFIKEGLHVFIRVLPTFEPGVVFESHPLARERVGRRRRKILNTRG
jgi:hypothetical protein